jgi:hypothetical protein
MIGDFEESNSSDDDSDIDSQATCVQDFVFEADFYYEEPIYDVEAERAREQFFKDAAEYVRNHENPEFYAQFDNVFSTEGERALRRCSHSSCKCHQIQKRD